MAWVILLLAAGVALPAAAQETPAQHDAANAENRWFFEAQNQLRVEQLRLDQDRQRSLLGCRGVGSAAAARACANNVEIDSRNRQLGLDNRAIDARNHHNLILKGIGVHRVP